jgi:hypothetical protein
MKKYLLFVIICALLMMTPTKSVSIDVELSDPVNEFILAARMERVYGTDNSREVFSRVTLNSYREFIIKLTENGSREYTNPADLESNNVAARDWIADTLVEVSNGRMEVEILGEYSSVLGRLPGYLPVEGPAFLVGGHFDSVLGSPGANDDATGVATALELARVLSMYEWPIDIYFGAWNAEEVGLLGSREVAEILSDQGVDILLYYNIDMLLVPNPGVPQDSKILMGYSSGVYQSGLYWAELTRAMSRNYGQHMIRPIALSDMSGGGSSDHASFRAEGYNSLFAHESGFAFDSAYHTSADVWNNPMYNYTVAIEAVKAIGASIAFTLARAYQEPTVLEDVSTLLPGREATYSITITTPTTINVSCRWWGGGTSITLYNSVGGQMAQMVDAAASPWEPTTIMSQNAVSPGIYTLNVFNPSRTSIGYEMEVTYETDIDGNGVLDSQEFWFDQGFFSMDSDLDSIDDGQEMILGTSRFSNDSDSDSMSDSWEIQYGLDPLDESDAVLDEDSDGLSNLNEFRNNCNPNTEDTDADSIPDLWEVENNLDPTRDDSAEDPDQDGVSNLVEYLEDTDPHFAEFRIERYFVPAIMLGAVAVIAAGAYVIRRRG